MRASLPDVGPNERWSGPLDVLPGEAPAVPCTIVRGALPGPTLVVTAGIHGAEYASIAAAQRLSRTPTDGLSGTLVVVPIVNTAAYYARSIYINPLDGKNLNRVFPGNVAGSASERLAHWVVTQLFSAADAYVDLHGGDLVEALVPFIVHQEGDEKASALAQAFGLDFTIATAGVGTTTAAAHGRGVTAVLAEAGGQGLWPEEVVAKLVDSTLRGMRHLGMIESAPETSVPSTVVRQLAWSRADATGCWYPAVRAGDKVTEGQQIGVITDLLGVQVQAPASPVAGTVLFSVSSMAINAGDPLVGVGAG
mgnify:CR=1 FL=1